MATRSSAPTPSSSARSIVSVELIRVVAAVFDGDSPGEFLAFRRAHHKSHGGRWEHPGGKVEVGESDREALDRELGEELAVSCTIGDYLWEGDDGRVLVVFYHCGLPSQPTLHDHDALQSVSEAEAAGLDWAPVDGAFRQWLHSARLAHGSDAA